MPISLEELKRRRRKAESCGNEKLDLELHDIAKVLRELEPSVERYFKNYIKYKAGINDLNLIDAGLSDSKRFLERLFAVCTSELVGGVKINEKGIEEFKGFVDKFNSRKEIHNLKSFRKTLESYEFKKHNIYSQDDRDIEIVTTNLRFHGMGQKTAALYMRFICEYCNFFKGRPQGLAVPLDRVNARMVNHLVSKAVLIRYRNLCKGIVKSIHKSYYQFKDSEVKEFQMLAEEIMGSKQDRIILDNVWFIGHFYHDSPRRDCRLRQSVFMLDEPYISPYFGIGEKLEISPECPFKKIGCSY